MYIDSRQGFVKLALQHGLHIVPAIAFGLRGILTPYIPKGPFWTSLGRKLGFANT